MQKSWVVEIRWISGKSLKILGLRGEHTCAGMMEKTTLVVLALTVTTYVILGKPLLSLASVYL